jgi:hypothetical protein
VLGWWGLGHRTIDWGTAGEWVPGLLTGAATVGALWWAVTEFRAERNDRHRYEQRRTLGELRAALEASESSLGAIAAKMLEGRGLNSGPLRPLGSTDPLVLSHMEARRQLDVLVSELDDKAVADLAEQYLDESLALASASEMGHHLIAILRDASDRRAGTYERLTKAIGQARKDLV